MTEKTYISTIDRQTTFRLLAANLTDSMKNRLLDLFNLHYCTFESVFFDIIRPLHSDYPLLDVYIAGSITSEIDSTKTISISLKKRVLMNSKAIDFISSLGSSATEVESSSLPTVNGFVVPINIIYKVAALLSGDEKKCHDAYKYQKYIFTYSDNKVYTHVKLSAETARINDTTLKNLVSTTYVNPVVIDNAFRLVLEMYNGCDNMLDEEFKYNTLSAE